MSIISKLTALPAKKNRVADKIAGVLARQEVGTMFGIPGGTISPLNDALLDHPSVKTFITRHESEAVFAACGHAVVADKVGVVFVTSGPGLTNALTGLASAKCDRIPLVLFAGEVSRAVQGKGALQDGSAHHLDMLSVTRSLAKAVFEIAEPRTAAARVAEAFKLAKEGVPGPVVITLPLDVLTAEVPASEHFAATSEATYAFDPDLLEGIQRRLLDEPRPLLYAGSGVRGGEGPAKLRAFAERFQIPVVTSPKAKGVFPEDHPLSLGVFGLGGHPSATRYVEQGIGTLLAVGTGLGDLATEGNNPALKPERSLIHVDVNPAVLGRAYATDVAVVGPAAAFFEAMLGLAMTDAPLRSTKTTGIAFHAPDVLEGKEGLIAPSRTIIELQASLPPDTLFVVDTGEHALFAIHYLKLSRPDQFVHMAGLGSMGSSIGYAIGAKIADPARSVCVIIGDGGMTMTGLELLDAAAHKLPLVVCMFNDERLGMCELGHESVYQRVPEYAVPRLDIALFAASMGARGHALHKAGDIEAVAPMLQRADRPILLDVHIDRSVKLPKRDRIGAMGQATRPKPSLTQNTQTTPSARAA